MAQDSKELDLILLLETMTTMSSWRHELDFICLLLVGISYMASTKLTWFRSRPHIISLVILGLLSLLTATPLFIRFLTLDQELHAVRSVQLRLLKMQTHQVMQCKSVLCQMRHVLKCKLLQSLVISSPVQGQLMIFIVLLLALLTLILAVNQIKFVTITAVNSQLAFYIKCSIIWVLIGLSLLVTQQWCIKNQLELVALQVDLIKEQLVKSKQLKFTQGQVQHLWFILTKTSQLQKWMALMQW